MIHIVDAQRELIDQVAQTLREADRRELYLATGLDAEAALHALMQQVPECQLGFIERDGVIEPLGIFGLQVRPFHAGNSPFLLGCIAIDSCRLEFHRLAKEYVDAWKLCSSSLWNWVDVNNQPAIDWLEVLGFEVYEGSNSYGVLGAPFRYFEWRAH